MDVIGRLGGSCDKGKVVVLQPSGIVDHVYINDQGVLSSLGTTYDGGSRRCTLKEVEDYLLKHNSYVCTPGGSASNVGRALVSGFGVNVDVVGTCGSDDWGFQYISLLQKAQVNTTKLRQLAGATGRSLIFSHNGQRTMRTFLSDQVLMRPESLDLSDFSGARWVFLSAYSLYMDGLLQRAITLAKQAGCQIALDLASHEVVQRYSDQLAAVMVSGHIDCCICNEDEARIILDNTTADSPDPCTSCVKELIRRGCGMAVVTCGSKGCVAGTSGGADVCRVAAEEVEVVDTTGAGDHFSAGLIFGLLSGLPLERCCEIAVISGAAAVKVVGCEISANDWLWVKERLSLKCLCKTELS